MHYKLVYGSSKDPVETACRLPTTSKRENYWILCTTPSDISKALSDLLGGFCITFARLCVRQQFLAFLEKARISEPGLAFIPANVQMGLEDFRSENGDSSWTNSEMQAARGKKGGQNSRIVERTEAMKAENPKLYLEQRQQVT